MPRKKKDTQQIAVFSNNLNTLMQSQNLTQALIAEMLDIDRRNVWNWCQGISMPTSKNLVKLAKVLEVKISELTS